jgi:predicted glycoside hydrolase/deacetylase ChbG (UPF0249 family)
MGHPDKTTSFGCHVVLVDGAPLSAPESVPSLLAGPKSQTFRSGFAQVAGAALRGRVNSVELETEVKAQIRALQSAGLQVSHVDSHKHVHLLPQILVPLLRAARTAGVRAVRNPFAPIKPLAFAHLARRPHLWKRYSEVRILRAMGRRFRQRVEAEGMVTTDGTFGIVVTGALTLELFEAIIGCIPEGTWELCCHPGYNDADLGRVKTRLRESRLRELETLTSDAAREALDRHGVELITYWDLV